MEVSTDKSKIMVNTSANITMNSKKLVEVTSFKYLGATLSKDGTSTTEVNKNCHGDRSHGQTEQVVDKQFHQLCH